MIKANRVERVTSGEVLASALLREAELWTNVQSEVLSFAEAAITDRLERWRETLETWSRSLKKVCECRSPIDFVQAQQEWLCDTIRLAAFDMPALADDAWISMKKVSAGFEKPGSHGDGNPETLKPASQPLERVAAE